MKKILFQWALIAAGLQGAAAAPFGFRNPEQYILADGESATNELWVLTAAADIRGAAEDDLFLVGGTLIVAGDLRRDFWALGDEVDFNGRCAGRVRIAGRTLSLRGAAGGNLLAVGQAVNFASGSGVAGDAVVLGEDVVMEGRVGGQTRIFAPRVTLSGVFEGPVRLTAEDIVVQPGTEIRGDLVYTSPRDLILDQRVLLSGQLIRREAGPSLFQRPPLAWTQWISIQVLLFLAALLVALPFLAVFPAYAGRATRLLKTAAWKCALAGAAAFALFPLAIFLLPLTLVGIPLSGMLLLCFLLLAYLGKLAVGLAFGGLLLRRRGPVTFGRAFSTLAFGLLMLYALASLPVVGALVWLLIVWLGMGSLLLAAVIPAPPAGDRPPPLPPAPAPPPPLSYPETRNP